MLFLKRNTYFNELRRCDISGLHIGYLDYYYEDDEDGLIVKFEVYKKLKLQNKREKFDYKRLNEISSRIDYKAAIQRYEEDLLKDNILEREVYKG